jgi:peptidoglycan/xylan/chitin deacetylase (PgdA/CDA1 family)
MNPVCCLKVDVDTHDGMRDGVPRLLDAFHQAGVRATFFLAFGPDNAGKAIWQVFQSRGFLKKMIATGAPKLYGWRTILSGTLLPARPIATKFPDLVRRIEAEGHEVAVHCWDHRLWQDHLPRLDRAAIAEQFHRAFDAFETILGRRPRAVGAPAWTATRTSLEVQDTLGLVYASDMRGGAPCYPELDGYRSTTLQIPTTGSCLEELLTLGQRDESTNVAAVLAEPGPARARVIPLHAEVEGGPYGSFLRAVLDRVVQSEWSVRTLKEHASACLGEAPPVVPVCLQPLTGRAGRVLAPAAGSGDGS